MSGIAKRVHLFRQCKRCNDSSIIYFSVLFMFLGHYDGGLTRLTQFSEILEQSEHIRIYYVVTTTKKKSN